MTRSTHSQPYRLLLDILVEARKSAGLTQAELAGRLGRPQPFISFVERGERAINVIEFYAILKAIGADPENAFRELIAKLPSDLDI